MSEAPKIEPIPVPYPILNEGEELVLYTPFVYKGVAPDPLPPCSDVQFEEEYKAEKQQQYEIKQKELEDKKKEAESSGSFFSKLSVGLQSTFVSISNDISKAKDSVTAEAKSTLMKKYESEFRKCFGLPGSEKLINVFSCSCINGNSAATGNIYISVNYLSFFGKVHGKRFLSFFIPLKNIVSIRLSSCVKVDSNAKPPVIHITDNPELQSALQIYCLGGTVHSFYAFWTHRYKKAYATLDRAWRNSFEDNISTQE